jgi:hypothetical protein
VPYQFSDEGLAIHAEVRRFLDEYIFPNEQRYYAELEEVGPDSFWPLPLTRPLGRRGVTYRLLERTGTGCLAGELRVHRR